MREITKLIALIAMVFTMTASKCALEGERRYNLYLQNDSDRRIEMNSNRYGAGPQYPDTSLFWEPMGVTFQPGEKLPAAGGGISWDDIYKTVPNDTLSFVIYDADTLKKYTWEEVKEKYMILQRYDLSLDDLKGLKFVLHYPPTNAMKNMKMFPAYKETER